MWNFIPNSIPSTCSREQAAVSLAISCWDTAPSGRSKSKNIAAAFCCNANLTDAYLDSLFGTISEHSGSTIPQPDPISSGSGISVTGLSSRAVFPVRTSAQPAAAPGSPESVRDSGKKWPASLAKYDRATSLWRTAQCSLFGGWELFAETWPRWGTMRNGELFPQQTPSGLIALREVISRHSTTFGNESGLSQRAPAPMADEHGQKNSRDNWMHLSAAVQRAPTPNSSEGNGGGQHPDKREGHQKRLRDVVKRVPTPRCEDSQCASGPRGQDDTLYGMMCRPKTTRLMTPNKRDWKDGGGMTQGNRHSPNLGVQVNRLKDELLLAGQVGGSLNPDWVEWLSGWPIGWTSMDLLPKAMFVAWLKTSQTALIDCRQPGTGNVPPPSSSHGKF